MCVHELGDGTVDSEGGGPLCKKMRGYGPTVQVREEVRQDNLCTEDCECAAHCVSQWGV